MVIFSIQCPDCHLYFAKGGGMNYHRRRIHNSGKQTEYCPHIGCGHTFSTLNRDERKDHSVGTTEWFGQA